MFDIIRKWKKIGFDEVSPNAALSVVDGAGRGRTATFELTNPKRVSASSNVDVQPNTSRSDSHWDVTFTFHGPS